MGRILVVEDEESLVELLTWVLRQEGYEVSATVDAFEGVELGLLNPPDLLITDWMLRQSMHGGEVARRIRADSPSTKTIVMTGYPEIVSHARQWQDCIDVVIEKPFHMRHLFAVVRRMLRQEELAEAHLLYQ